MLDACENLTAKDPTLRKLHPFCTWQQCTERQMPLAGLA